MFRGKNLSLSVYGTSHGPSVGCLLSGIPPGLEINMQTLESAMRLRKTGENMPVKELKKIMLSSFLELIITSQQVNQS